MSKKNRFFVLLFSHFLFTFQFTLVIYQNSTLLGSFLKEAGVNSLYSLYAIIAMVVLAGMAKLVARFGNKRLMLLLLTANTLALLFLGLSDYRESFNIPLIVVISFLIHSAVAFIFKTNLDIETESFTKESEAGTLRGTILTATNLAWLSGPALAGLLVTNTFFYGRVYLMASFISFLLLFVVFFFFRKEVHHDGAFSFFETLKEVQIRSDLRYIFMTNFLMHFFFSWMVIYLVPFLVFKNNFTPAEISIIVTAMLIPYLLIDVPLGKIADKYWGEKELLIIGFFIAALFTFFIPFLKTTELLVWAAILFGTRIGAATIEIMSETYFFKKIKRGDDHLISFFRNGQPLAYISGPIAATLLLYGYERFTGDTETPYQFLFLCLAFIVLYGLRYTLPLRDTR
jgi:MFS family permease